MRTHCKKCGAEFTPENTGIFDKPGRPCFRFCVSCNRRRATAAYKADPEIARRRKKEWQNKKFYGVNSLEERDAILAAQGGGCAICGRTDCHWGKGFMNVWHIDHDPLKPGTYRGVLCGFCNTALGRLEPNIGKVLTYLKSA